MIIIIGMAIVIGGIIVFKMHPIFALLFGALVVALLTPGTNITEVGAKIAANFGTTCGRIAILIIMAGVIGKCMLESGAAERIVRSFLKLCGLENTPLALIITSFFVGIPVFFDTLVLMMFPLAKSLTIRTNKNYLFYILCIIAGAAMANGLVPPNPGPIYLAEAMQIPIDTMIIGGIIVGSFTLISGYFWAKWANKKWDIPLRDSPEAKLEDIRNASEKNENLLPPLSISLLPVMVPITFIIAANFIQNFLGISADGKPLLQLVMFFGEKNIALTTGAIIAILILAKQIGLKGGGVGKSVSAAILGIGPIILITGAGGAFGAMLQQTGISAVIANMTQGYQMALIPLAFVVATAIRTAQGSATVSLLTTAGVFAGMITSGELQLEYNPMYIAFAIGCGSKMIAWMNDSGFWVVTKMSGFNEREALKTYSPMLAIMGFTGLIVCMIGAKFLPFV